MARDRFPPGVAELLKWYVYRLIDPRNGETFYVGKGTGDRIFQHARGALTATPDESAVSLKFQRIKEIQAAPLDVAHVIHRHHIEDEQVAYEIEAALIDAYHPGLANEVEGHGSGYGCQHVEELITKYAPELFEAKERLLLIFIGKQFEVPGRTVYDAARTAWRINVKKAEEYKLVLAHRLGLVVGVFRRSGCWVEATKQNFPWLEKDIPGRWGFGEPNDSNGEGMRPTRRLRTFTWGNGCLIYIAKKEPKQQCAMSSRELLKGVSKAEPVPKIGRELSLGPLSYQENGLSPLPIQGRGRGRGHACRGDHESPS
jgi:hypothetical protein